MSAARLTAVRHLVLEAATVEVVEALRARGIASILLKGPALARWLYADESDRPYGDIDLLVAPRDVGAAETVLARLGFADAGMRPGEGAPHASPWRRATPPAEVDLHRSVFWLGAGADEAWAVLRAHTEPMPLSAGAVDVLDAPARTLMLALHACLHGREVRKPLEDLRRGLEQVDERTWVEAAELAELLGAARPFAAGLRLAGGGGALAARLGLPEHVGVEAHLKSTTAPSTSEGFLRLAAARSMGDRLRLVAGEIAPSPGFMRAWQPVARRGRTGMVAAYAWRPFWLMWKSPRGAAAWARARRAAG